MKEKLERLFDKLILDKELIWRFRKSNKRNGRHYETLITYFGPYKLKFEKSILNLECEGYSVTLEYLDFTILYTNTFGTTEDKEHFKLLQDFWNKIRRVKIFVAPKSDSECLTNEELLDRITEETNWKKSL